MKRMYVDLDIMKNTTHKAQIGANDLFEFLKITHATDLFLPCNDYMECIQIFSAPYYNMIYSNSGRTEDNQPYFMVFGIKFIMINEEDANKYRILK